MNKSVFNLIEFIKSNNGIADKAVLTNKVQTRQR